MDEGRQPLSRKLPISSSKINPYRMIIVLRIVILCLFFHYRILHPVYEAYGLWLTSVICEIWFAASWILDQFPKWCPIVRETYLDRLSLRYIPCLLLLRPRSPLPFLSHILVFFCYMLVQIWKRWQAIWVGFYRHLRQYGGSIEGASSHHSEHRPVYPCCRLSGRQGFMLRFRWWCCHAYFWSPFGNFWVCKKMGSFLQEVQYRTSSPRVVFCPEGRLSEKQSWSDIRQGTTCNEGLKILQMRAWLTSYCIEIVSGP